MDIEKLKAEHPELYKAVLALGATAERERIQAVQSALIPGHEALIAVADVRRQDDRRRRRACRERRRARDPREAGLAASATKRRSPPPQRRRPPSTRRRSEGQGRKERQAGLPVDERCKAHGKPTPATCARVHRLADYTAYTKAVEAGKVKQLAQGRLNPEHHARGEQAARVRAGRAQHVPRHRLGHHLRRRGRRPGEGTGHARPLVAGDASAASPKRKADNSAGAAAAINVEVIESGEIELASPAR
jgi:hypothetical protein